MAVTSNMKRLIDRYGQTVTLIRVTQGSYNTATASASPTTASSSIKAYLYDFTLEEVNGTNVVMGDRRVLISGLVSEPFVGDRISGIGDKASIKQVQKLYNGPTVVVYLIHVGE